MEDGGAGFVGFFQIEREVEGPVVEVVGVDEGLVDGEAVFGEVGVAGFGIGVGFGEVGDWLSWKF